MAAPLPDPDDAFAFGRFLLIPAQARLLENQAAVRLAPRAFDVLAALVEAHGQVVGKRALLARVWPGMAVDEGNLKVTIGVLRRVLGEGAGTPSYIATVVGRGYRFIAPVHAVHHHAQQPGSRRIVGRDAVIATILQDLDTTRLVSIVGPGGVGKTTVARAVADRVGRTCWFVDLSSVDDAAAVQDAITRATRPGDPAMVLIVDNCEHVIGAAAQCVDQLLASTRNATLIVTSREPLAIRGERVRRLAGLGLPPAGAGITAAEAAAYPAVQLFADQAGAAFTLDDTNAAAVCAICHRLDGLALAIARVAQRAGTLGIAAMLEHLDRRFHMLDGYHAGPARHRTLTAAVHTSYLLLTPSEQATLRRLAERDGAFSLAAACGEGADRAAVQDDIASLVAKSLLLATPCDGAMQYRLAHLTRAFVLDLEDPHAG